MSFFDRFKTEKPASDPTPVIPPGGAGRAGTRITAPDWFGRSEDEGYTYYDRDKKLIDWDSGHANYSDFFFGGSTYSKNRRNEESARLLGSMFRVMGVPKSVPKRPKVEPGSIQIPFDLLKDSKLESAEATDIFMGSALHNASEYLYSTNADRKIIDELKKKAREAKGRESVESTIFTIINDERVDQRLGASCPGYSRFLQKYKDHKFDKGYEAPGAGASPNARLLDLFMRFMRFPMHIVEEEMDEFGNEINHIRKMLEVTGGLPETAMGCQRLSKDITRLILEYEPPRTPGPGGEEEESEGGGGDPGRPGSGSGGSGGHGSSGSSEDDDFSPGPRPMEIEKELEELAKEMMDELLTEKESEETSAFEDFVDEMTADGVAAADDMIDIDGIPTYFRRVDNGKTSYMSVREKLDMTKSQVIVNLLKRKNRDYSFTLKSMRSGRLDTNKLVEARQQVPNIYERMGAVKTDKLCVVILIDESGSMGGAKIQKAREAAIFLNETFGKLRDVELFIYGHSGDQHDGYDESGNSCDLYIYREPGYDAPYALGNVRARSQNRDGNAIKAIGQRVRKFSRSQGVYIVISDGEPAASGYGGNSAMKHTRKCVKETEHLGFQVIQVAIASVRSKEMFDHFITMTNIKELPTQMATYLRTRVSKMIKEKVTL